MSMTKGQLKAVVMALMAPNGVAVNMNDHMLKLLDQNSDRILKICLKEEKPKEEKPAPGSEGEVDDASRES